MNSEQTKVSIFLLGVLALFSFFISIGNESDIWELRERQDSLQVEVDSLKILYECANIENFLMDAKYR